MLYDAIVIAGTTESRIVIEELLSKKQKILAVVATQLGEELLKEYDIDIHSGRLDTQGFIALFTNNKSNCIIDASHPFAKEVTNTVKNVCQTLHIPYKRYERGDESYDYDHIIWAGNAKEAAKIADKLDGNILLTTGANTVKTYAKYISNWKERVYVRVLNTSLSLESCYEAGMTTDHVIGAMPPYSLEDNKSLLSQINAKVLISKDSGLAGGVPQKVQAAKELGIPVIMIKRPEGEN